MKREIKFRAWDKENKYFLPITPYEWINGTYVGTNIPQKQALNTFEVSEAECNRKSGKSMFLTLDGFVVNLHPVSFDTTQSLDLSERYELMQFTGLHDKNGREIYDGDIFQVANNKKYEVRYMDKGESNFELHAATFVLYINEDIFFPFDEFALNHGVVIGNIFENPELLS